MKETTVPFLLDKGILISGSPEALWGRRTYGWTPAGREPYVEPIDFIKTSRYARSGKVVSVVWRRGAHLIFELPLSDYRNRFRAIRTGLFRRMQSHETGFAVPIEEVYLASPTLTVAADMIAI